MNQTLLEFVMVIFSVTPIGRTAQLNSRLIAQTMHYVQVEVSLWGIITEKVVYGTSPSKNFLKSISYEDF
jgi:hypothetical protein